MNDALHNVKRESELRDIGSNAKTRYVSRFEPLALHPRLHHRVGFPIHYRSTELLSQSLQSHRGYTTTIHLYRRGIRPVANTTNIITSTEEGSKNSIPLRSTSTKEGYNKSKEGLQLRGLTSNTSLFSLFHKTRS